MKQKINELIRIAAEQSSNIIVIADAEARIYWVNQSFLDNTGYMADEVKEQPFRFLFRFEEAFDPSFEGKREAQWANKQGETIWVYLNQIQTELDGRPYIMIIANVISRLKDLEFMSRDQQILIDGFSNSFSEVNIVVNWHYEILALNKLARSLFSKMLGIDLDKRKPLLQDMPPEVKVFFGNRIYKTFKGGRTREKQYSKRFDKYFNLGFYPISNGDGDIIAVSIHIRDITKEVNYLKRLRAQKNLIAQLAWDNSHEFRRPVANIVGLTDWLHTNQIYGGEEGYMIRKILENSVDLDRKVKKLSRQLESIG